jgi:hypothetical protein
MDKAKVTLKDKNRQELPPFVKTWNQFYRLLVVWLILLIAAFYLFTNYFK